MPSSIQVGSGSLSCRPWPTECAAFPRLIIFFHSLIRSGIQTYSPLYLYMATKRKCISHESDLFVDLDRVQLLAEAIEERFLLCPKELVRYDHRGSASEQDEEN